MNDLAAAPSTSRAPARDVWRLLSGYWRSQDRLVAWLLLLAIPAVHVLMVYQGLLLNRINGAMFDALGARQGAEFWRQIVRMAVVMLTWVAAYALVEWLVQILQMRWRTWLNAHFLGRWLGRKAYYRLDRSGAIDNPDQRLSDDLQIVTGERGLKNAFEFLHQMGVVVVFTGVLWNLTREIAFDVAGRHVAIPGLVVVVFILFCVGSTGLVEWLGQPLLRARYRQQAREGDFRFGLVRVRENVEPIALYAGERAEQQRLDVAFAAIRRNWRDVVRNTFGVNLSMQAGNQGVQLLPWLLGAGAYFAGGLSLGQLSRLHQTCNQLRIGLLWFIQNYTDLADVRAALARLVEFDRLLDAAPDDHGIQVEDSQDQVFRTFQLALETPDGSVLAAPLSLEIKPASSCVIVGPSGCGKSTLLLSLAGLWPYGHGRVEMPSNARVMFIPQRPYVPIGTLRQALCYPADASSHGDADCVQALVACRLAGHAAALDQAAHWGKRLSPGEQQRLAFARALLKKPDLLFLDEATSALDTETEAMLYRLLRTQLPGCTLVSVAHRETVMALHERRIVFAAADGRGTTTVAHDLRPVLAG